MSDTSKIRQTLDDINSCLESLKNNVESLKSHIGSGMFVDPSTISDTTEKLLTLKNFQNILKKDYNKLFPASKCSDFLDTIKNEVEEYERLLEEKELFEKAKFIIIKFKSIRSDIDECQLYLNEYASKLENIETEKIKIDEYKNAVKPYEDFYDIVEKDDIESRVKYTTCSSIFSNNIHLMLSLIQGRLYIDYSMQSELDEEIQERNNEPVQLRLYDIEKNEEALEHDKQMTFLESAETENDEELVSEEIAITDIHEDTDEKISEEDEHLNDADSENISKLIDLGVSICARTIFDNVSSVNNDDGSMVSTKTFKKDMERFKNGNAFLLLAFNKFNYLNKELLESAHKLDSKAIDFTQMIDSLLKLGYIKQDSIGEYEPIYSLTSKTVKYLESKQSSDCFKTFRSFQKISWNFKGVKITDSVEEYQANVVLTRIGYCKVMKIISDSFKYVNIRATNRLSDCYYSGAYEFGVSRTSFYTLSCFFTEKNDIYGFLNDLRTQINEFSKDIEFSLLISDNAEECSKLMNFLKSYDPKFEDTVFLCFDISNNSYYDLRTYEEVSEEKIKELISEFKKNSKVKKTKKEEIKTDTDVTENEAVEENTESINVSIQEDTNLIENSNQSDIIPESKNEEPVINDSIDSEKINESDDSVNTENLPELIDVICYPKNILHDDIMDNVYDMINLDKAYCASAYLGVVSSDRRYEYLKNELSYALNTPEKKSIYISNIIMSVFDDTEYDFGKFSECLKVCAELRVLFYNTAHQDYMYKQMYAVMKTLDIMSENAPLAEFAYKLEEFKNNTGMGIDAVADYRIQENLKREKILSELSSDSKNYYETYIISPVKENCALPRYVDMKRMIFDKSGDLAECLKIVADNNIDEDYLQFIKEFLISNFFEKDKEVEIKSSNIRKHFIEEYIDKFWHEAGKIQRDKQASSKLVSSLRNNILKSIRKIVDTISEWYYHSVSMVTYLSKNGNEKDKNLIKLSLNDAIECIDDKINNYKNSNELNAGYNCIRKTLIEFQERLNGTYNENLIKYYYIDFLKYGDVMLDSDFLPDFKGFNVIVNDFMPSDCIIRHSKRENRTLEERIDEIFFRTPSTADAYLADDYGCAQLIREYRNETGQLWNDDDNDIDTNREEAIKQFKSCFENFKGSLELSQSYGQIDNDRKEQLLSFVSIQFRKIEESHNYGYFSRIISAVEATIKQEAKIREKTLEANLNTVENDFSDSDEARSYIAEAREMMKIQNYTVAEDLIHRIQNNDFSEKIDIFDNDNFIDFIEEYDSNYSIVSNPRMNLKKNIQISRRPMKDTKGGKNLIEYFPLGNNTSPDKIKMLLNTLGFRVENVVSDLTNKNNYESYSIDIIKSFNIKRDNYTHPISPFGSLSEYDGFRVICLYGTYEARRLLDKFREIGATRHTIVLLDFALSAPERHTLARKIKEEMSDKIFIVIDRVAILYLANHYTETTINRMLMEITMPYSSFQPYSIDSARPIPVEMFMGRKEQLEDIMSPSGANIICGGRQLGKSALLRMAKTEIDNNENGDRAVYVEIKGSNCRQAAKKISEALVDAGVLEKECETSDWHELSRQIKKRLNSDVPKRIPYLLLLIDEADIFIEDCKNFDYAPLDDLEDIQSVGVNRFKFVVAGLRNLVKFEKEKLMSDNRVFAHLSQKTIRPFTFSEARELLEKPLHYLGIRFPKDQSYLISLILASTNYFPGLIHFYCAKLIEAVRKYDPIFDENTSPPYEVTESHIKRVLADPEFRKQIKDKFEITLKLDTDNYYHIIVILMAYCHYSEQSSDGYTAEQIYNTALEYDISKIKKLNDVDKLAALMDELCELNILRKNISEKYLFASYNFLQLLGKSEEIDEAILKYSEEN